jgi:Flp pilus assembly protein TadD
LLLREGDVSGASDLCREAVAVAPYYPTAHANWGIALRHQGKLREAIAEYRRAIELNNADPVPHHNLGITLLLDGRVSAAVGEFEQAAQLHPDPPAHTWFHLGLALYEAGREADSLKAFEKQLRLSADNNVQSSEPLFSSYDFGTVLSTAPANDKYLREVAAQYVLMIREKLKSK